MSANVNDVQFRYLLDATDLVEGSEKAAVAQDRIGVASQKNAAAIQTAFNNQQQTIAQTQQQVAAYDKEIAILNAQLKDLVQYTGLGASAQAQINAEMQRTSAQIAQVTAQKRALATETAALNAQLTEESAAAGLSAAQIARVGVAVDRMAGIHVAGARSIGLLVNAFSLASIGQLALIAGAALLIGKLFELIKAKEEVLKVDKDWLVTNQLLAERSAALNDSLTTGTDGWTRYAFSMQEVAKAGIEVTLLATAEAQKKVNSSNAELVRSTDAYNKTLKLEQDQIAATGQANGDLTFAVKEFRGEMDKAADAASKAQKDLIANAASLEALQRVT
jgi:hypothetical protein